MSMIEKKANGEQIVVEKATHPRNAGKAPDLMAALQASLAKARGQAKAGGNVKIGSESGRSNGNGHSHARRRKSA
jgi:non-homologous end joining protein Ku